VEQIKMEYSTNLTNCIVLNVLVRRANSNVPTVVAFQVNGDVINRTIVVTAVTKGIAALNLVVETDFVVHAVDIVSTLRTDVTTSRIVSMDQTKKDVLQRLPHQSPKYSSKNKPPYQRPLDVKPTNTNAEVKTDVSNRVGCVTEKKIVAMAMTNLLTSVVLTVARPITFNVKMVDV